MRMTLFFFCLCGCLFESRFKSRIVNTKDVQLRQVFACDLRHERYRLNQTFDTCKWEHVSCLAACYKLTTPATSRKEFAGTVGNIPQALQLPSQRWMTTLRSLGCKLIACNKNCRFQQNVYCKKPTIATSLDSWLFIIAFFNWPSMLFLKQIMRRLLLLMSLFRSRYAWKGNATK